MDLAALLAALTNVAEMSDEALAELRANLKAAAHLARHGDGEHDVVLNSEIVSQIAAAAEAVKTIEVEQAQRAAESAELLAQADAAMASLDGEGDGGTGDGGEAAASEGEGESAPAEEAAPEGDGASEGEAAPEGDAPETAAADTPDEGAETPQTLAASATRRRSRKIEAVVPGKHKPKAEPKRTGAVLVASGEVRGVAAGHEFGNLEEAYRALHTTWRTLRASSDGRDKNVLTMDYRGLYDDAHTMVADPWENAAKVAAHVNQFREALSLTASGGVPGPGQPRYELLTYGTAARPVRDAVPVMLAPRGIVNWNVSPTIDDFVVDTSNAAINFATSATDASGGSYKTVQEITAPTTATATVEAEYARLQHGNFADKFLPELMAAWMKNLMVRYARHNDQRRLAEISAGSTKYTDTPAKYGAYRDLKRAFIGIVEEIEDHLRDPNLPIRVLMPEYLPGMLATDLIAQAPGDDAWRITEEGVRADMQAWEPNVNITWILDGTQTNQRLLTTPSGQSPRSPGFDADVDWWVFPEGTWAFLDGGTLDLGIVRDSTLNAQNRFQTFTETWEVMAKFGPLSYRVVSSLCADGDSQVPTDIAVCSPQGS